MRWGRPAIAGLAAMLACFSQPPAPSNIVDASGSDAMMGSDGSAMPFDYNYAFVSRAAIHPTDLAGFGSGDPLAGGDVLCTMYAHMTGLPGSYRAWLSKAASVPINAVDRFSSATVGWVRRDHKPVAADITQLGSAGRALFYPMRLDEAGVDIYSAGAAEGSVIVFTGTSAGVSSGMDCMGYGTSGALTGGYPDRGIHWSDANVATCTASGHLYCLRTDGTLPPPVLVSPPGGKLVWISASRFMPGTSTPDAVCGLEQTSSRAVVATAGASADSIVNSALLYRADNVTVGSLDAMAAPIDTDLSGSANASANNVWIGAGSASQLGNSATNCAGWNGSAGSGLGMGFDTSLTPWGASDFPCTTTLSVICVAP